MNAVYGKKFALFGAILATSIFAEHCYADVGSPPQAQAVQRLFECRALTESAARLACYDAAAASLQQAEQQGEIVVVERQRVLESRRALFGFTLPDVSTLLGAEADQLNEVETTLERASFTPGAGWTFYLADSSVWRQIDSTPLQFRVREGLPIKIRRASMGTYFLKVSDNPAVRAKRQ
ncbi:hypothetical protein [Brevundimonas sp.]|uniref:hypothetical protein n=1 Tax=Brevundimonas sp. TaxID=1871086 RepID=UPI0028975B22|nr:hypothetical protein [Brevundimonas sp.]